MLMNKYETVVITKLDAGHEAQQKLYEKVCDLMEKMGAKPTRFEVWGKRKLAYPIQKNTKAMYSYYVYLANGDFVKEFTRLLRLSPIVLRYMTIKVGKNIDPAKYDFDKERLFETFPTETEDTHEHVRPTTGWDPEYLAKEGIFPTYEYDEEEGEEDEYEEDEDEDRD